MPPKTSPVAVKARGIFHNSGVVVVVAPTGF
jgi:hypothetical protein